MNKEKIVGLSDRLNEIVDEANRHPNGTPGFITWDKAVYAIEALSKEVNSKINMPKVFDEWYKNVIESHGGPDTRKALSIVFNTLLTVESSIYDESESSLKEWLVESDSIEDLNRISKCIDAIRYGYEVEK